MQPTFWPREHGAYAQLGAPLMAALVGGPRVAAVLVAVAAVLAFLAHEPLLVVLGHRGRRARELRGARARTWLIVEVTLAFAAGVLGLAVAPHHALAIGAVVAVPIAVTLALAIRKQEHTLGGELVAAIALSGAGAVVSAAGGASVDDVAWTWLAWSVGFGCTIVAVHRVMRRRSKTAGGSLAAAIAASAAATLAAVAGIVAVPALAAAAPLVVPSAWIVARPPPVTRLRAIGVTLAIASVASVVTSAIAG